MASNPFSALISPADVGAAIQAGAKAGREMKEEHVLRQTMARIAQNPDDEEAAHILVQIDPKLGMSVLKGQRDRSDKGRFTGALARYMGYGADAQAQGQDALSSALGPMPAGRSALAEPALGNMASPTSNALAGALAEPAADQMGGVLSPTGRMPAPAALGGNMSPDAAPFPVSQPTNGRPLPTRADAPDDNFIKVLGQPKSDRDAAFLDMLRVDPKAAFEMDSEMRDRAADHLKQERDAFGFAVSRLAAATDEASYQEVLADLDKLGTSLGMSVADHLPPRFPGGEGMQRLRLGALDAKDQLDYLLKEGDTALDNARADRNTDSLIDTRDQRVQIYRDNTGSDNARADRNTSSMIDNRNRPRGKAAAGGGAQRIVDVQTPEQARSLPKGTRFRTPDGRVKVR